MITNSNVLALLVDGNQSENYFNIVIDTLILNFIWHVINAVLDMHLIAAGD